MESHGNREKIECTTSHVDQDNDRDQDNGNKNIAKNKLKVHLKMMLIIDIRMMNMWVKIMNLIMCIKMVSIT